MTAQLALAVLLGFATYRATRLVTGDTLTDDLRGRVFAWAWTADDLGALTPRAGWKAWLYELVSCPFCIGVWFALGATVIVRDWPWSNWHGGRWLLFALAVAGVQALLARGEK